jgi:hypothetical protein
LLVIEWVASNETPQYFTSACARHVADDRIYSLKVFTLSSALLRIPCLFFASDDRKTFPRAVNPATQVTAMLESSKYDGTDSLLDENEAQPPPLDENEAQLSPLDESEAQLSLLDENEAQLKEVLTHSEVFTTGVGGAGGTGLGLSVPSPLVSLDKDLRGHIPDVDSTSSSVETEQCTHFRSRRRQVLTDLEV